jgi:aldehyde dehydrogenase
MATLNETDVRRVVEQVLAQLHKGGVAPARTATGAAGVHGTVNDAVAAAKEAFDAFGRKSIDDRRRATARIRRICIEQSTELGRRELDETKIGRLDHKIEKLVVAGEKSPGVEILRTDCYAGDNGVTLQEFAPFGVIGAITPVTHSLPTLANNAISMLASGNTVVFNAHPSGAEIAKTGVRLFNEAMRAEIGIDNLITIVDPPSIESAQGIFDHPDVKLLVVTGGPAVARAALASRKRAIVAGPGNPPVVVDDTACPDNAATSIIKGAAYDNNLLCIGEKEVFATAGIFDRLLAATAKRGGFRLDASQIRALEQAAFQTIDGGKQILRKELVGKDPAVLARAIGVTLPDGVEILFGETSESSPFVDHEQMMPFVPFVRTDSVERAIELAKTYEHGFRHTAIIHSRNTDIVTRMGREMDTTLFIVNGPSTAGLGVGGEGLLSFSIATPTGEGVTSPLTFTRSRRVTLTNMLRTV